MTYWIAFAAELLVAVVRVAHADDAFLERFALAEDRSPAEVALEEAEQRIAAGRAEPTRTC